MLATRQHTRPSDHAPLYYRFGVQFAEDIPEDAALRRATRILGTADLLAVKGCYVGSDVGGWHQCASKRKLHGWMVFYRSGARRYKEGEPCSQP